MQRFLISCVVLLVASACGHSKGATMSHSDAEGLWQQAREVSAPGGDGKSLDDTYTFKYEDGLVTLRLMVISKMRWKSADSFYTLKARWDGNALSYQTPSGRWSELALFEDGKFVMYGDGMRREYDRIQTDQVADFSKAILEPRAPFDYSLIK
jgi:hypothetical protein